MCAMPDPILPNGHRLDNDGNNTKDLAHDFSTEITATKKAIEKKGGEVPPNAQFVVVEKGDCLWNIANEYNVDPLTLIEDNKQFKNPDLIHPGEVVVVRLPDGNKDPKSSGAVFGHQSQEKATADQGQQIASDSKAFFSDIKDPKRRREALDSALTQSSGQTSKAIIDGYLQTFEGEARNKATADLGDSFGREMQASSSPTNTDAQWQQIEADSQWFFAKIPDASLRRQALDDALTGASGRTRQEIVEGYLQTFPKGKERETAAADLKTKYSGDSDIAPAINKNSNPDTVALDNIQTAANNKSDPMASYNAVDDYLKGAGDDTDEFLRRCGVVINHDFGANDENINKAVTFEGGLAVVAFSRKPDHKDLTDQFANLFPESERNDVKNFLYATSHS